MSTCTCVCIDLVKTRDKILIVDKISQVHIEEYCYREINLRTESIESQKKFYTYKDAADHYKNQLHKYSFSVEEQLKDATSYCVLCGAKMKLKNGEFGEFYGCSQYPKCKCVIKLNGKMNPFTKSEFERNKTQTKNTKQIDDIIDNIEL